MKGGLKAHELTRRSSPYDIMAILIFASPEGAGQRASEVYLQWREKYIFSGERRYLLWGMKYIFNREPFPFLIRFQSSSGSTPVFFVKYWSTFREGLESFPEGTGEISVCLSRYFPGNGPGRAETNRKKVHALYRWLIFTYRFYPKNSWKKVLKMFGSYVLQHYFCTRFREGKWHGRLATATVREEKRKNFRKSLAVQKNSLPLRSRSERERQEEEIFERIFIPTKVVQVSRPESFRIEWAVN